jgi:hypothetical protein
MMIAPFLLAAAAAVQAPAGTEVQVRLKSKVATDSSKPKEPVDAVVIVPVLVNGTFVIPAGAKLRGYVQEVKPASRPDERAIMDLAFSELDVSGVKVKLSSKLIEVDNARESVDESGRIVGILASETISARLDQGINKVGQKYSGLADILEAAKGAVLKATEGEIVYEPGVEMKLALTQPLEVKATEAGPKLEPIPSEAELIDLVNQQPFQTVAEKPPKPSDMTNVMFIGSPERLEKAFTAAGWATAAGLNAQSKLETFRAIAELRGYKEAPMSILLLEGQKPGLVFQKQNNTFAQRHHLRIWRRPLKFRGHDVWVCAATHDIGIDFSQENRTFIHKIDPQLDRERAKVVNDLLMTGLVKSLALVERPAVPHESSNATGDKLITDGRMAVVVLE